MAHQPVLLQEVIGGLALRGGETVLDATVNRAGHAAAICAAIGPGGHLVGLDADPDAIAAARNILDGQTCRATLVRSNFRDLKRQLANLGISSLDACLFDLGTSSEQLAAPERGFSFRLAGPLDMTFGKNADTGQLTAETIVNDWSEKELTRILRDYGEERFAERIVQRLLEEREAKRITATVELAEIVRWAVPPWSRGRRLDPATKTFQALRLAVNDELNALLEGLGAAWSCLRSDGRLAVITFHSLEARLVKNFFRSWADAGKLVTRHAVKPARAEILKNPRSRSAQLRIIKKI